MMQSFIQRSTISLSKGTTSTLIRSKDHRNVHVNMNVPFHQFLSTQTSKDTRVGTGVAPEEMPFRHFRVPHAHHASAVTTATSQTPTRPTRMKFNSPRKKANKIFSIIQQEAIEKAKNEKPAVHNVNFRVGDSIEMTMISQGAAAGSDSTTTTTQTDKIRGVVLGIDKRGLGSGIYLRDVVFGEPIDRKISLYSPLLKDIKRLEENFVFKKKRKVKRAKLYYLRDRAAQETRVTKW